MFQRHLQLDVSKTTVFPQEKEGGGRNEKGRERKKRGREKGEKRDAAPKSRHSFDGGGRGAVVGHEAWLVGS